MNAYEKCLTGLLIAAFAFLAYIIFVDDRLDPIDDIPIFVDVQSAVPDIIVLPSEQNIEVLFTYERRYTEELVNLVMSNRDYPWIACNITSAYVDKGLWIVTVEFQSFSRQYIFDERK